MKTEPTAQHARRELATHEERETRGDFPAALLNRRDRRALASIDREVAALDKRIARAILNQD